MKPRIFKPQITQMSLRGAERLRGISRSKLGARFLAYARNKLRNLATGLLHFVRNDFVVLILCNLVVPSFIFAAGSPAKITLLEKDLGVRSLGMAGTYVGLVDDPVVLFSNPASLSYFTAPHLNFMYSKEIVDMQLGSAGFVLPQEKSGFGIGVASYDGGKIEINQVGEPTEVITAESTQVLSFGLGRALASSFSLGINAKIIRTELLNKYKDDAYAVDIAGLYRTRGDRFCLGVTIQNIGTQVSYRGEVKENLPLKIQAGLAGKIIDTFSHTFILSTLLSSRGGQALPYNNWRWTQAIGVEYTFKDLLSLRGGCKINHLNNPEWRRIVPTAGLGFNLGGWRVDYAWLPDENFGDSHRVSLGKEFGIGSSYKFKKGTGYFKKRMFKKAICQWEKIPRNHPDYQKAQKGITKAKKSIATRVYQSDAKKHYRQGRTYLDKGQYELALAEFDRVMMLVPDYKDAKKQQLLTAAVIKGNQLFEKKKFEEALEAYSAALKLVSAFGIGLFDQISPLKNRALEEAEAVRKRALKEAEEVRKKTLDKAIERALATAEKKEVEKPELPVKEEPLPSHLEETLKKGKLALGVANFVAREVSLSDAWIISDFLRVDMVRTGTFRVVERESMDEILGEIQFQQTGCTERECAVEIGHLLNVQIMIVGNVTPFLGAYYVTVDVVDVKTGVILYADRIEAKTGKEVEIKVQKLAQRIAAKFSR